MFKKIFQVGNQKSTMLQRVLKVFLSKLIWLKLGGFFVAVITHLTSLTSTSLKILKKMLDKYCKHYDKFMLVGDFNAEESEPSLSQFLYEYNVNKNVKESTCFKNALNPSCIDLFTTNSLLSLVISDGLSNFHKMVITVMKMSFKKHSLVERHYRDYKYFDQTKFKNNLNEKLNEGISNYELFETTFIEVLKKHAPLRKKFPRANHALCIKKNLEESDYDKVSQN